MKNIIEGGDGEGDATESERPPSEVTPDAKPEPNVEDDNKDAPIEPVKEASPAKV